VLKSIHLPKTFLDAMILAKGVVLEDQSGVLIDGGAF